ncbi:MAG: hypothetical protein ABIK36_19815 [Pseudomonadota bacterium]
MRDDLGVEQDSEHPATDIAAHVAEAFGQGRERKQRRHDAVQHLRPCPHLPRHRVRLSIHRRHGRPCGKGVDSRSNDEWGMASGDKGLRPGFSKDPEIDPPVALPVVTVSG